MSDSGKMHYEEMEKKTSSGMFALIVNTLFILAGIAVFVYGIILLEG